MTNLVNDMEAISQKLLTGQITQAEALAAQRKLLGQPDETPEPTPAEATASKATKIATALAKIQAQKADISAQLRAQKDKAKELNGERERLLGAIATSEQRLNILSGSPTQYRNAKAEAIAHGLLTGEPVDLASIGTESEDLVDRVSAVDLKAALQVLRQQMQEVERKRSALTSRARNLSGDYYELHAKEHGILFAQKALELVDEYAAVQAAHRANLSLGGFSTLAPDNFATLNIVSPLPDEVAREIGITRKEWSAAILENTNAIRLAQTAMVEEMEVAA